MPQDQSDNRNPLNVDRVESIDSTGLEARRRIDAGLDSPLAIVAARQTGGVGRLGRRWVGPLGGLWLSLAWPTDSLDPLLGLRTGVIVVDAIECLVGRDHDVRVKWPNDVLLDGRKLAGVLVENIVGPTRRWTIVGVGINANIELDQLPESIRPHATTIRDACGREIDLARLEAHVLERLSTLLGERRSSADEIRAVRDRLWGIGQEVIVTTPDGAQRAGVVNDVSEAGALIVTDCDSSWPVPTGAQVVYPQRDPSPFAV
jgi:BirA family biotin operon repressor/biotin-[acetyl-CoA-carboxylase] ligase